MAKKTKICKYEFRVVRHRRDGGLRVLAEAAGLSGLYPESDQKHAIIQRCKRGKWVNYPYLRGLMSE